MFHHGSITIGCCTVHWIVHLLSPTGPAATHFKWYLNMQWYHILNVKSETTEPIKLYPILCDLLWNYEEWSFNARKRQIATGSTFGREIKLRYLMAWFDMSISWEIVGAQQISAPKPPGQILQFFSKITSFCCSYTTYTADGVTVTIDEKCCHTQCFYFH